MTILYIPYSLIRVRLHLKKISLLCSLRYFLHINVSSKSLQLFLSNLKMPSNTAAWLTAKGVPLEVKSSPYTSPGENEIVVKNGAVAINIVDWSLQDMGETLFPWLTYPHVLGADVAGEVVEVGSAVSRFQIGDRVIGHAIGNRTSKSPNGAFQMYTVVLAHMASPIPSSLTYESAAVLPLAVSTAACGLFQKDHLALQYPSISHRPAGKALLIWGGSSSVGSNAIQLAVAAGYEVITTASPKNFDYVKKLGASQAFDYHSNTIVDDLIDAFKGKTIAGALAVTRGSGEACVEVVDKSIGDKFVSMAMPVPDNLPSGVGTKFIFASDIKDSEVSKAVYVDFLPKALAGGKYIVAPDPQIAGKGLQCIQTGLEILKKGVSAKKVVVSL